MSELKEEPKQEAPQGNPSRRDWLFSAGVALNVIAGVALAIPLVGFVFSSFAEKKDPRDWISLGPLDHFPEKTTRIATYRNPYTRPWDGETAEIPCWVRRIRRKAISDLRHQLYPSRLSGALVSGIWLVPVPLSRRRFLEDGSRAAGPPPRGLFQYDYKVEKDQLWVKGGEMPTLSNPV